MYEIVSNATIGPQICQVRIAAPKIACKRQAGQFVIVRPDETSERVPLTVVDSNPEAGTITLIVQSVGRSTRILCGLQVGERVAGVVGPLGQPTHIARVGRVAVIGGGIGTAVAMPIAAAMKAAGNEVVAIIGGRSRDLLILEEEMRQRSDRLVVCTDDGSYGRRGLVTEALREIVDGGTTINEVVAIGPVPMMEAVAKLTRGYGIATMVSLNPIMIDGTGMCGGCRVTVGGEMKFACVDGPEFDGHQVDFKELRMRLGAFKELERESLAHYEQNCRMAEAAAKVEAAESGAMNKNGGEAGESEAGR